MIYRVGICIGCGADCRQLPAHNKINPNPNAQSQVPIPIPISIPGRVTIPRARTRVTASSNAREKTKQHDILSIDLFEFPLIRDKGAGEEGSDRTPSLARLFSGFDNENMKSMERGEPAQQDALYAVSLRQHPPPYSLASSSFSLSLSL